MSENKPIIIALVVVGILIIGYVLYVFTSSEPESRTVSESIPVPESRPAPVFEKPDPVIEVELEPESEAQQVAVTPKIVEETIEPLFVLPRLDDSDQLIRDGVVSLTRHEGINAWLGPSELIRKIVVFIDNVANGSIVRAPVAPLAPRGIFTAKPVSAKVYLLESISYDRYDLSTNILVSVDTRRAVEFYVLLKPLFQEAYDELGYPDAKFDAAIFKAIGRLLETPVISEPVRLIRPVVMFEFEDPQLESLSSAQKQLLRMGPRNTRVIQAKLSELALELRSVLEH